MSLYCRNKTWWVSFTTPDGQRVRQSAKTDDRLMAEKYHDHLKNKYWRAQKLGENPRYRLMQALQRYLSETSHKASHGEDKFHSSWLARRFGELFLDEVTNEVLEVIIQERLGEGVTNARCNRLLAMLRAVLRNAMREWGWVDKAPNFKLLPETKHHRPEVKRHRVDPVVLARYAENSTVSNQYKNAPENINAKDGIA